ncbi:MAG: DUF2887 domain-containing protein [candidate division KSB1 bacterium]
MQTDSIFYELFLFDPQCLSRLVQLKLEGEYGFESITVKTTEKRFDGFFRRLDGIGPHLFLEVQGYLEGKIYWKLYREICIFYEQRDDDTPFIAVVLFLDESYDPGEFGLTCLSPCRLIRANLIDCLKRLGDATGTLTPLMPLTLKTREELVEAVPRWKTEIKALNLNESREKVLEELLINVIAQKFTDLSAEEISTMLHLTPLEQTTAGKQIFGSGWNQGLTKGELIGKIEYAQSILGHPVSAKEDLLAKSPEELSVLFQVLELESKALMKMLGRS